MRVAAASSKGRRSPCSRSMLTSGPKTLIRQRAIARRVSWFMSDLYRVTAATWGGVDIDATCPEGYVLRVTSPAAPAAGGLPAPPPPRRPPLALITCSTGPAGFRLRARHRRPERGETLLAACFDRRIRRNPASPRYRSTGPCSASCSPAWRLRGDERILLDMSRQLARKGRARRSSSTRRPCPGGGL